MLFIKTFESYLQGQRAPLYHFTENLYKLIKDDILNLGQPSYPKNIKAICLTRFPGYGEAKGSNRLQLDTNKLIRAGFKPTTIAEIGSMVSSRIKKDDEIPAWKAKQFYGYSKPFQQGLTFTHGVDYTNFDFKNPKISNYMPIEFEFEERIYKPISNIGKYIDFIDLNREPTKEQVKLLIDYIKKYPHIVVRKLKYKWITTGKLNRQVPLETPTEILLDINMIK